MTYHLLSILKTIKFLSSLDPVSNNSKNFYAYSLCKLAKKKFFFDSKIQ